MVCPSAVGHRLVDTGAEAEVVEAVMVVVPETVELADVLVLETPCDITDTEAPEVSW